MVLPMGIQFAIRDDDASFFTKPEELERAYDFLKKGCVSLSVVPYAVPRHTESSKPYGERDFGDPHALADNEELVCALKEGIKSGRYDILLHGYSHEYQKRGDAWIPEMLWKDGERLAREITEGKAYLQSMLDTNITVFAAPSNRIDQKGIAALEANRLHFCGIIHGLSSRALSPRMAVQFAKRWLVRLIYGIQRPGIMNYGGHLECNAYPLNDDKLLDKEYEYCKKRNIPFVVYTHYWKVNENGEEKQRLVRLYDKLMRDGAECVSVSSIFEGR